jgi:hypothetical protein
MQFEEVYLRANETPEPYEQASLTAFRSLMSNVATRHSIAELSMLWILQFKRSNS